MIRIGAIKLNPGHTEQDLLRRIAKTLRIPESEIVSYEIHKQSIDARKKPLIQYVYTVDIQVANKKRYCKKQRAAGLFLSAMRNIHFRHPDTQN